MYLTHMPKISREEVIKLAKLSRINLTPDEVDSMSKDLESILGYMDILNEADVSHITDFAKTTEDGTIFREDVSGSVFDENSKVTPKRLQKEAPEEVRNSLYKAPSSHEN